MSTDVLPIIEALARSRCRFVVIGSVALQLIDGCGEPSDLDIVVRDTAAHRRRAVAALVAVGGRMSTVSGLRPIESLANLPSWSWRVITAHAPVDVIFRFADGTGYADHAQASTEFVTAHGTTIRCRRTRHAA